MGLVADEAEDLALKVGHSIPVLRRHLSSDPDVRRPSWARNRVSAKRLLPFALAGSWVERENMEDRTILQLLGEVQDGEIERIRDELLTVDDAPIARYGHVNIVVSQRDALFAAGQYIEREDLDRFFSHELDLICIASPTAHHAAHLSACLSHDPRYILMEKPVAPTLSEFQALKRSLATAPSARIYVNYFRRSLPQVAVLREACASRDLVSLELTYSRGLDVNGVHLLDLAGDLLQIDQAPPPSWVDGSIDSPSFGFDVGDVSVTVKGYELPYHCIEARAVFTDGRLSLLDGGARLESEEREENPNYPGFFHLAAPIPAVRPSVAARAMLDGTYLGLCNLLNDEEPLLSSLESAAFAQEMLELVNGYSRR